MARWIRSTVDAALVDSLARELRVPALLARLLAARGLDDAERAHRFLHPSLDHLHDPYRMLGMKPAVERLRKACASAERILIYGDYDADGTTAIVLLRKALELAGGCADFHLPHRLKDGYGMREEVIERAAAEGVRVIVSVDTGIRAADVVDRANQLGIDTVITDHHLPDGALPPALAVLNPNQHGCDYPDKNLSGAGVAFKVAQALLGGLDWPAERLRKVLWSMLRITAIGTVADVVPLVGENRVIVRFGLDGLRRPVNAGLKAILTEAGFVAGQPLTAGGIAFRLAPRLNAAGRMDTAATVIELFSIADPQRAAELAAALNSLNADRQQTEALVLEQILESLPDGPPAGTACLIASGEGWHRGVVGIVASRLVERFHRPALVVSIDTEERVAYGSGRSIRKFHLLEAMESVKDLFIRFGGHRQAVGFSLPADRVDELRERLNQYAAQRLTPDDWIPEIPIEAEVLLADITDEKMRELEALEPFGFGNPEPTFAASGLRVAGEPRLVKEKHLRLNLWQDGKVRAAVAWNMAGRVAELPSGAMLDAAFTIQADDYQGLRGWRMELRDIIPR